MGNANSLLVEHMRKAKEAAQRADEESPEEYARGAAEEARQVDEYMRRLADEGRANADGTNHGLDRPVIIPTREEIEATKKRLQYRNDIFHFAITGVVGTDKSAIINALRGLPPPDGLAWLAHPGVVDSTSKILRFPDSNQANPFAWYDIPGAGTLNIPDWVYFTAQGFYIFDAMIVLTDNRLTQRDEAILKNCIRFKIPTYIVRARSKQHIQNVLEDMPYYSNEEARLAKARERYISETREAVARDLHRAELPHQRVYMVDSETLFQVAKGSQPTSLIDEETLLKDMLSDARTRRVQSVH